MRLKTVVFLMALAWIATLGAATAPAGIDIEINSDYEPIYNEPAPLLNPAPSQLSAAPMSSGTRVFRAIDKALAIAPKGVVISTGIAVRKFGTVYQVDIIKRGNRILYSPTVEPPATGIYTTDQTTYSRPQSRQFSMLRKAIEKSGLDMDDAILIVRDILPETSIYYVEFLLQNGQLYIAALVQDVTGNEELMYNVATGEYTYTGIPEVAPVFTANELLTMAIDRARAIEPEGELVSVRRANASGSTYQVRISLNGGTLAEQLYLNAVGPDSFGAEVIKYGPALSVSTKRLHARVRTPGSNMKTVFSRLAPTPESMEVEAMELRIENGSLLVDATVIEDEGAARQATFDAMTGEEVFIDPTPEGAGANPSTLAQSARVAMSNELSARFISVEETDEAGKPLHVVRLLNRKGKKHIIFTVDPSRGYAFERTKESIDKQTRNDMKAFRKLLAEQPIDVHAAMESAVVDVDADRAYRMEVVDDGDELLIAVDLRSEEGSHRILMDAKTLTPIADVAQGPVGPEPDEEPVETLESVEDVAANAADESAAQLLRVERISDDTIVAESMTSVRGVVDRAIYDGSSGEKLESDEVQIADRARFTSALIVQSLLRDNHVDLLALLQTMRDAGHEGDVVMLELAPRGSQVVLHAVFEPGDGATEVWVDIKTDRVIGSR